MDNLQIIQRTDPGYEAARVERQFNMRVPDRFPLGVIKITEENQIVQAVKLAAEMGCRIAVLALIPSDDLILFGDFDDAQWESIRHSHVELPFYPRGLVAGIDLTMAMPDSSSANA
ncbi:unnamed protein product [Clonostachys rosea f. rosea IK726]|uniref:Uncharacterized protein n=1 Tax=Clonostachys rosea f. rosea IK726 TaxID=1349383 RepID=A0ACA9UR30_BIOOC|nr:unnamed protein product [Clonostachys rosea f. rosea IK726]